MVNKNSVEASENNSYLRFMRKIVIILMILIPLGSFSQKEVKLKKRHMMRDFKRDLMIPLKKEGRSLKGSKGDWKKYSGRLSTNEMR